MQVDRAGSGQDEVDGRDGGPERDRGGVGRERLDPLEVDWLPRPRLGGHQLGVELGESDGNRGSQQRPDRLAGGRRMVLERHDQR